MLRSSRLAQWQRHARATRAAVIVTGASSLLRVSRHVYSTQTRVRHALKAVDVPRARTRRTTLTSMSTADGGGSIGGAASPQYAATYGMGDAAGAAMYAGGIRATTTGSSGSSHYNSNYKYNSAMSSGGAPLIATRNLMPSLTFLCLPPPAIESFFFREMDSNVAGALGGSSHGGGAGDMGGSRFVVARKTSSSTRNNNSGDDSGGGDGGGEDDGEDDGVGDVRMLDDAPLFSSSHNNNMRRLRYSDNTGKASSSRRLYCRLCSEELDATQSTRAHMWGSNRSVHTCHPNRETLLNTMGLLAMRGYPVDDDLMMVWADVLYRHEAFARVHDLVSPRWSIERRVRVLLRLLQLLRSMGVLDISLTGGETNSGSGGSNSSNDGNGSSRESTYVQRRRLAFERLEYIGDCSWGTNVSSRIMVLFPVHQWPYSENAYLFNSFRDGCEMNVALTDAFDLLQLQQLVSCGVAERLGFGKMKADAIEALLGELHCVHAGLAPALYDEVAYVEVNGTHEVPLCALVQHCLCELYDLLVLGFVRGMFTAALPLAKELGANYLWRTARSALRRNKQRRSERHVAAIVATNTAASASSDTTAAATTTTTLLTTSWVLPALRALHTSPQPYPRTLPHPLLPSLDTSSDNNSSKKATKSATTDRNAATVAAMLDELPVTRCTHTGADVFARMHRSFVQLQLLREDTAHMQHTLATPPRVDVLVEQLVPHLRRTAAPAAQSHADDDSGNKNNSNNSSSDDGTAATSSVLLLLHDDDELAATYMHDEHYALHTRRTTRRRDDSATTAATTTTTTAATTSTHTRPSSWLSFACDTCYPPLLTSPSASAAGGDASSSSSAAAAGANGGSDGRAVHTTRDGWPVDNYVLSCVVPPQAKAPMGGVVTERNLCRGQYAFLAYGFIDALRCSHATLYNGSSSSSSDGSDRHDDGNDDDTSDEAHTTVSVAQAVKYWQAEQQQRCRAAMQAASRGVARSGSDKSTPSLAAATTSVAAAAACRGESNSSNNTPVVASAAATSSSS